MFWLIYNSQKLQRAQMSLNRGMYTENVVHLHNGVLLGYWKQWLHEILRQIDRTRKYHPEWGNPVTKEHIWFVLTEKWILAPKFRIPKIQFIDHMKLKKKTKVWVLQSFLEKGTKYSVEQIWRQSAQQKLKERSTRDCPTWGFIPDTVTKLWHYCGC